MSHSDSSLPDDFVSPYMTAVFVRTYEGQRQLLTGSTFDESLQMRLLARLNGYTPLEHLFDADQEDAGAVEHAIMELERQRLIELVPRPVAAPAAGRPER